MHYVVSCVPPDVAAPYSQIIWPFAFTHSTDLPTLSEYTYAILLYVACTGQCAM